MSDPCTYSLADGIATLAMDDGKANAMAPAMSAALNAGLDRAAADEAKAVIVKGRPGLLCGGFDLKIIRGDDEALKAQMREAGMKLLERLYLSPLPIVFAATGHAVAMGALLLLAGDWRVGTAGDFRVGLNETGIGLSLPIAGLELARDRLAPQVLGDATINARLYSPAEAAGIGYLDEVAAADALDATARAAAERLGALDPAAFALTNKKLRQPTIDRIRALGA
jgi:enoyl-CoA hydratase